MEAAQGRNSGYHQTVVHYLATRCSRWGYITALTTALGHIFGGGDKMICNLLLYLTTKHVFENFRWGTIARFPNLWLSVRLRSI